MFVTLRLIWVRSMFPCSRDRCVQRISLSYITCTCRCSPPPLPSTRQHSYSNTPTLSGLGERSPMLKALADLLNSYSHCFTTPTSSQLHCFRLDDPVRAAVRAQPLTLSLYSPDHANGRNNSPPSRKKNIKQRTVKQKLTLLNREPRSKRNAK